MSIESIVNQSLDLIGYKRHIGSIWDGSPAARIALNAFAETRDEVLAAQPWDFARSFLPLSADTGVVPPGWLYAWVRPDAAINILDVYSTEPDLLDPQPTLWLQASTPDRTILTRFTPAIAAVTYRITDTDTWTPQFTVVVIRALAEKLQRLGPGPAKEAAGETGGRRQ